MTQRIEIDEKRHATPNFKTYLSLRSLILLKPSPLERKSRVGKMAVLHLGHPTLCSFTGPRPGWSGPRPEGPCQSHSACGWRPRGVSSRGVGGGPALRFTRTQPSPSSQRPPALPAPQGLGPLLLPIPWAHGLGPRPLLVPRAPAPPCWPPLSSLPALWGPRAVLGPLSFEDQPWPWGRLSQPPASQAQLPPRFLCWIWNYPDASFQLVLCSWARPVTEQPSTKGKLPGDGLKRIFSPLVGAPRARCAGSPQWRGDPRPPPWCSVRGDGHRRVEGGTVSRAI